jgi:N-acetylmuramoyl-L-alanine amidase
MIISLKLFIVGIFFLIPLCVVDCEAKVVVIDPGHGGNSPAGSNQDFTLSSPNNARTPSGLKEKDLTLELALVMRDVLQKVLLFSF